LEFVHLDFEGKTTSPWSIGRRYYSNYIYCQNFLWGRAIRGPILGYLLKTYCPNLSNTILPCDNCEEQEGCPYHNLNGCEKEGELKDTPKLIVTTLTFDKFENERLFLTSKDAITNGTSMGVNIEHIPIGTRFNFEVVLTGSAVRYTKNVVEAINGTLALAGWGGRCSRGYGRGRILKMEENNFDDWVTKYLDKRCNIFENECIITLNLFPILILETGEGPERIFTNIVEKNFILKLTNCMNERYWQFFKLHHHLKIKSISGLCGFTRFRSWSRKDSSSGSFGGLSGDLTLQFEAPLTIEDLRTIGISWYGIGRYKNQGFGSLRIKEGSIINLPESKTN
jgi:hypothetical protein